MMGHTKTHAKKLASFGSDKIAADSLPYYRENGLKGEVYPIGKKRLFRKLGIRAEKNATCFAVKIGEEIWIAQLTQDDFLLHLVLDAEGFAKYAKKRLSHLCERAAELLGGSTGSH